MKTENLNQACDSFELFCRELRAAHNDARDSGDGFADIFIFHLLHDLGDIGWRLARAKEAAK